MTESERALFDRVELVLGHSMAIALPADMVNRLYAKWTDDLGPGLLAIVRRLDAENERMRAVLLRLRDRASDPDYASITRVLGGEK